MLDVFDAEGHTDDPAPDAAHREDIGFGKAEFSWTAMNGNLDINEQVFRLRIAEDIVFQKGVLNLIYGPTACGKTSMLMALLGEMHYTPLGADSWVNLPKKDGVAYASQESWVLSETIKVSPKRALYIMHMIHPHLHRKIFCSERHSTRNVTRKV